MGNFLFGVVIGFVVGLLLFSSTVVGRLDDCRRDNPGFDCDLGWIVGSAF